MNFESFLESCDKHSGAIFGLVVGTVVILGTILVGIVQIINAVKNQNTDVDIEYDTDNG